MLQFGLRQGRNPQQVVTTTPRNVQVLKEILAEKRTVVTTASTWVNRANLAPGFFDVMRSKYDGTSLGRQELDGELVVDIDGAMWNAGQLDGLRVQETAQFSRIVVAVDPPVTGGPDADECGIVVVGVDMAGPPRDWRAVVLEDASVAGASPQVWAEKAINAFHRHKADRLVAEVNQGGDLVRSLIATIDPLVPFRGVRATRGKAVRAEPVAALYEQGRVQHFGRHARLEDQMCAMSRRGYEGKGSPDRVDALVWALTDLMIEPAAGFMAPRIRAL
jgi:phage terminase large subunit-like protein